MYKLSNENFNRLEKYIIAKGENYNEDRCIVIPVNLDNDIFEVTMCMNELTNEARICQVNGKNIITEQELLTRRLLNQLLLKASITTYSEAEEIEYNYYLEEIKMATECCDMNCVFCKFHLDK